MSLTTVDKSFALRFILKSWAASLAPKRATVIFDNNKVFMTDEFTNVDPISFEMSLYMQGGGWNKDVMLGQVAISIIIFMKTPEEQTQTEVGNASGDGVGIRL